MKKIHTENEYIYIFYICGFYLSSFYHYASSDEIVPKKKLQHKVVSEWTSLKRQDMLLTQVLNFVNKWESLLNIELTIRNKQHNTEYSVISAKRMFLECNDSIKNDRKSWMPYRIRPSSIIIKRIVFLKIWLSHFSLLPVCATELRSSFVKSFLEVNKADVLEDMNTFWIRLVRRCWKRFRVGWVTCISKT